MAASWKTKESSVLPLQTNKGYHTLKTVRVLAPLIASNPEIIRRILTVTLLIQVHQYFTPNFPPFPYVLKVLKCELNHAQRSATEKKQ